MARNQNKTSGGMGDDKPTSKTGGQGFYSHRFINVYLNEVDTKWLAEHVDNASTHVWEWLASLPSGYSVTVSEDAKSGKYNAMCRVTSEQQANNGLVLSVRAKSATLALYALAYADVVKLKGAWAGFASQAQSDFN